MKKIFFYALLYLRSAILSFGNNIQLPEGIKGSTTLMFLDPDYPEKRHGVVAFLIPQGANLDNYSDDLFGPFGYSSSTGLSGKNLYARDTWGLVRDYQLPHNPKLEKLMRENPEHQILLAGVRPLGNFHLYPLNQANKFILVKK